MIFIVDIIEVKKTMKINYKKLIQIVKKRNQILI